MDPSLSMNTMSGHVDLTELERRAKVHAVQRVAYEAQRRENEAAARAELQALQAEVGHNQRAVMQNAAVGSGPMLGLGSIEAQEIRRAQAYGGPTPLPGYGFAEQRHVTGKVGDARALADALCSMLSDFAGEHGSSEGAVECLARLLAELRRFRQHIGGDLRKWVHDGPSERGLFSWTPGDVDRILKDLEATTRALEAERAKRQPSRSEPGKMFTLETICAVLRGQKAALDHGPATEDPIIAAQHRALAESIRIFENLE